MPIPSAVRVTAMVDTGASHSLICRGLVDQLSLVNGRAIQLYGAATGSILSLAYPVYMIFYDPDAEDWQGSVTVKIEVAAAQLDGQDIACIIGRDVLAHALFVYDGQRNTFTLSFAERVLIED